MNKARRKAIGEIVKKIEIISSDLYDILSDEEYAFESMPESLQYSERGEVSQEAISVLEDCTSKIDEIAEDLDSIC